jgi:hypothetical protein
MLTLEICLYIISYDVWFYLSHIGLHHIYLYTNSNKDTYIGQYLENCLQRLGIFVPLLWVNFSVSFYIALLLINIRGTMRHDGRCIPWIGNHHKHHQYNFGEYWLDYYCGTQCPYIDDYKSGLIYM